MKFPSFFMLTLVLLVIGACNNRANREVAEINALLDSLQSEYAPDTRIAHWELEVSGSKNLITLVGEVDNKAAYKAIVQTIDQYFPEVENTLVLLPEGGGGSLINGLVNNSVAHLRSGPRHMADMLTQALLGTPIRILKEEEGWFLVQTPNRYLGWLDAAAVEGIEASKLAAYKQLDKIVFSRQYGFAYEEPDVNSRPVSDLVLGCLLPVVSKNDGFYEVGYPDGRMAWVKTEEVIDALELFNKTVQGDELVETAMKFNGIPYLWGGTSSKGVDCSGFTSMVYYMNGAVLLRDADQQSHFGREITTSYDYSELMAGDLLFFGSEATGLQSERVTHVAIYVGDTEFIHASGKVKINSMDPERENFIPEYPDIFLRAVRIKDEIDGNGVVRLSQNEFYKEIISFTE